MMWGHDLPIADILALKPGGYFTVKPAERGQVVSVHIPGEPVTQYLCASPGMANQLRIQLSEAGLAGYVEVSA